MADLGGAGRFPLHPVAELEVVAYATPNPCEGSIGHLRGDLAWEIADDFRRVLAEDQDIVTYYEPGMTVDEIKMCIVHDATRTLHRWTASHNSV